jgi:hypothetical protein
MANPMYITITALFFAGDESRSVTGFQSWWMPMPEVRGKN